VRGLARRRRRRRRRRTTTTTQKKKRTSVSLCLKEERWRVPLRPKTWSREGREPAEKCHLQLPLRKKKPSNRKWRKLPNSRSLRSRKGLLVARVARSPLAPPHRRRLGAPHRPSLATPTTRGPTRTDSLSRRGEWTSPQKRARRERKKRVGRRERKAATRSSPPPPPPLGGSAPGPPPPPRTPTTARAGRSTD